MDYSFGAWIKRRRKALDLTQQELAQRVGCSASLIFKIESDERSISRQIAELLAEHLEIPSDQRDLFMKVARQEKMVDSLEPSPLLSAPHHHPASQPLPTKLPFPVTSFVGREHELLAISQQFQDPTCRLLTLTGPGGVGKTRLAIEVAHRVHEKFDQGAYFVSLVGTSAPEFIIPAIAGALGFSFSGAMEVKAQLFNFLKGKSLLLVLDNLEHLLDGIELLVELLELAPYVKILTTSREPLSLRAEWIFEVQGLPVPPKLEMSNLDSNSAAALFIQRAKQGKIDFQPASDDLSVITHICKLVEGLPLGLELAAAWIRTMSLKDIAQEIERSMDFLTTNARDVPQRHNSIRAVFDHSWKLLSEEEQGVLLRLSAFHGGFRREAAEQAAEATISVLSSLAAKSLVRRTSTGRFDLHELIRQFAARQLAQRPEEQTVTQARHGRYYMTYFSQADGRLRGSAQRETLAELTAEMDNFRAAWDWALAHGEFALIEPAMRTFWWYCDTRGWFQEAHEMLSRTVDALEMAHGRSPFDRTNQVALGHFLATRSWFAYRLAQYEQAQGMLERSLEILRPLNEPRVLVESISYLGRVMELTGNYAKALELYVEGLEIATGIGDRWFAAFCLTLHTALVGITYPMVEPEITHERLQSVVADWRVIGDLSLIAFGLDLLSQSALSLGRYDEARSALEENIALNSSIGFGWGLGTGYRGLGIVEQAQGRHQQAVDIFRNSLDAFTELGGSWSVARVLAEMGISLLALGNEAQAERVWREALRIATDIHGTPVALEALAGFASLQAKQGDLEHAFELVLIVLNHPASFQETRKRCSDLQANLEMQLTPAQVEAIWSLHGQKSFEAVVEDALK
jgi:predicted ATPase/transcriptional regulator with XRE-family HTH domain